jgi:ParB family chromosome partitioning protein
MDEIKSIPIKNIVITGDNPRQRFDEESLRALGESIKTHGLLQPVIVRPKEGYYELVVGERRLRAAQLVGLQEIDAKIQDLDDATCMELRLIENTHREDLTDAEKGDAVYMLMLKYPEKYPTIKSVADAINVPYETVRNIWCAKSRKLSEKVRECISGDRLEESQGLLLMKYDHSTQDKLASTLVKHKLTKRQTIEFLKKFDINPKANLDDLADEVLGIKKVEVELAKLSPEARREVEEIAEEKKKLVKEARKRAIKKASEAPKRRIPKRIRRRVEVKPPKPEVPPPKPTVEKIPEVPETRGVSVAVLMPTELFGKITSLAAEKTMQISDTIVYCLEKFFEWREKYGSLDP